MAKVIDHSIVRKNRHPQSGCRYSEGQNHQSVLKDATHGLLIKSRANADVCRHQGIEFDPSESLRRQLSEVTDCLELQFFNAPQHTRSRTVAVLAISYHRYTHLYRATAPVPGLTTSDLPTAPLRLLAGRGFLGLRVRMCSAAQQRPGELFRRGVRDAEVLALVTGRLNHSCCQSRHPPRVRVQGRRGPFASPSCLPSYMIEIRMKDRLVR
ncbi:MAG: hypothetical protein OXG36_15025 [Caldilineaceae bacterium]|nr:hypothetical protein [Caldilineaceae bacterium]